MGNTSPRRRVATPGTPAGEASLLLADDTSGGERVAVGQQLIIGRSSRCDLTLPSQLVSRTHAEIVFDGRDYILRDLGSVNGTVLNGNMITSATLRHGDQIRLGDMALRFESATDVIGPHSDSDIVLTTTAADQGPRVKIHGQTSALHLSALSRDTERSQRAHLRLQTLVTVTENLARLRELDELYPMVVDEVMRVLPAERAALLTLTADGELVPRVARHAADPGGRVEVSRTIVDEVCEQRVCVLSADAVIDDRIGTSDSIMVQDIRSVLAVPIEYDTDLLGVLYLDAPGRGGLFTEEDLHFVSGLAGVAAVAVTNARALDTVRAAAQQINHAYLSMLAVLANAIEARDHYTIGHTWRVARFAQVVARQLGWEEGKISEIEVGGMLHDIGKIGVPDSILTKEGPLSSAEQELMELHPQIGARMLRDVPSLVHALPYVLHHHERFDGRGYPHRLRGEEIPVEARLLAAADALDAMTSNRPYRRGLDHGVALAELEREAGRQFDPKIVAAVITAYSSGELTPYLQAGLHDSRDMICPYCSTCCTPEEQDVERGRMSCPTCNRMLVLEVVEGQVHAELA